MTGPDRIPPRLRVILDPLKAYLIQEYGDRPQHLILFGSQARGEATPDSDIDVLIVLADPCRCQRRNRTDQRGDRPTLP